MVSRFGKSLHNEMKKYIPAVNGGISSAIKLVISWSSWGFLVISSISPMGITAEEVAAAAEEAASLNKKAV